MHRAEGKARDSAGLIARKESRRAGGVFLEDGRAGDEAVAVAAKLRAWL